MPLLAAYLLWRSIRQPSYRSGWGQRFLGWAPLNHSRLSGSGRRLWVHAVSVGETRAAEPLIRMWLAQANADDQLILTHTTPTGMETGRSLFSDLPPGRWVQGFLPYDLPWANAAFFRWARPSVGLLMETELWPNLLSQAKDAGIPMVLANARLSERSLRKFLRLRGLAQPALDSLDLLLPQTQADSGRFAAAGFTGRQTITGNLKFDVVAPSTLLKLGSGWRSSWPHASVLLAASTRDDEEAVILEAWRNRPAGLAKSLLLLVPRHPQRFERVADLAVRAQLKVACRSKTTQLDADTDCWIGDSLGEMAAYIAASDLALMGGSLITGGGQNPIEVCAQGRPVFFGPHMFNFQAIARDLIRAGAGYEVTSAEDWLAAAAKLLENAPYCEEAQGAARSYVAGHQGSSERTHQALWQRYFSSSSGPAPESVR